MDNSSQTIAFQMFLQMFGEDCLCDKNGCLEAYKYKNLTQEQAQKSNTTLHESLFFLSSSGTEVSIWNTEFHKFLSILQIMCIILLFLIRVCPSINIVLFKTLWEKGFIT